MLARTARFAEILSEEEDSSGTNREESPFGSRLDGIVVWEFVEEGRDGIADAGGKEVLKQDTEIWGAGVGEIGMSALAAPVATPGPAEGQVEAEQSGGSAPAVQQQETNVVASNPVARDTSSIPGVSMYARQWYPSTFFKHEELVGSKQIFLDALNKFHTVLGTRLTYGSSPHAYAAAHKIRICFFLN